MRYYQRLFNVSPSPESRPAKDKYGRTYWLRWIADKSTPILYSYYRGRVIGQARMVLEGYLLVLGDIIIFGEQHRTRGIGSMMLREVITYGKHTNAEAITGFIVEKDANPQPWLFEWYRQHGFLVNPADDNDVVARIYLKLNSA